MIKKLIKVILNSSILFCVVSFLSFLYSLINTHLNYTSPNLDVGFPFNFYYQFAVKDNCNGLELLHGTKPNNFIYNYLFCLLIMVFLNNFKPLNNSKLE